MVSHSQIMLYYPNLIGYFRFITNIASVKYAFDVKEGQWIMFAVLYSISQLLDAFDGMVARKYD
mgnify:FL=1